MTNPDPIFDSTEFLRRVTKRYVPGHWIGGIRKAFGPVAEVDDMDDGLNIDTHPPHYLVALWQPLPAEAPFIPRWPYKLGLVAPDSAAAVRDLLTDVPGSARLWLAAQHIDWAFIAEIVMVGEEGLKPYHYRELQTFVRMERQSTLAAISLHYGGNDEVFQKFTRTTPGRLAAPAGPEED